MKESKRQRKFASMLMKELGDIFQKHTRDMFGSAFITITGLKVSPDLSLAKVYMSFMMVEDPADFIKQINEQKGEVRRLLGNKIRKQVRSIPELIFYHDNTSEHASRIEYLLSKLDIPPEETDDEK